MSVTVYTTPTCGFCHQVKSYLQQRNVPFVEHDVSRDRAAAMEMVRLSGQQGVPVVVIDGQVVVGFNRPAIDQLLTRTSTRPRRLGAAIADSARIAAKKNLALPAGAYVGRVELNSPAALAGLQVGDVITQLGGHPVLSDQDVDRLLAGLQPGQAAGLAVWRKGQALNLTARF